MRPGWFVYLWVGFIEEFAKLSALVWCTRRLRIRTVRDGAIISDAGRRTREGQSQAEIAEALRPIIENILDELDRWLSMSAPSAQR